MQTTFPDNGLNILVVTRGHPFERDPFFQIFEEMDGVEWSHVEHPAAQLMFTPEAAEHFDAYVLYDMPGIRFNPDGGKPAFIAPPDWYKDGLNRLLDAGQGLVLMHHAIAGWPAWEGYAEIVGGRFCYQPMTVRGQRVLDSGYRHEVTHTISPVAEHPVTAGIEPFTITDELYLCEIFEADVTPLLRSDYSFTRENFYSADLALNGRMFEREGWDHPDGSNLIGWTKKVQNSELVYLQCGDAPAAYENANFRKLLRNAIEFVSK